MNLKLIVGLCAIATGGWYSMTRGKQIDEADVRKLYAQYVAALDKADGKALCGLFDDKVTGQFKSTARSMKVNETLDKATACAAVDEVYQRKQLLEANTGAELATNFEVTIHSIAIAPDRKSATVDVLVETRIGTAEKALYDRRSQQTDRLTKNFWRTKIGQSDGTVSFFY